MKPKKYRDENHITKLKIIRCVVGAGYNGYNPRLLSAVENGNETGVMLCPDATKAIKDEFPGYYQTLPFTEEKPRRKSDGKRKRKNRFYLRTDDDMAKRITDETDTRNITVQSFLLELVTDYFNKKAASDAGTSKAANNRAVNKSITWIKENVNESV